MTLPNAAPNRIDPVLDCLIFLGSPILPIWGVNAEGVCDCPKRTACESPGKHPHKNAPSGVNSASRDPAIIRQWARSYPNANWALRCGEPMPGGGFLAVLDEDPRNGSEQSIAELPAMPDTVTASSGGQGRHRLVRFPHPPAGRTVGPGLDLQGVGKYIVIAPSRHYTGGYYSWNLGEGPGEIDVADAPEWLVEGTGEATPRPDRDGEATAEHTVLGELFILSNMAGPVMPSGQMYVKCPNFDKHTDGRGRGEDASTVILPPAGGSQFGGWSCKHSNCANLKWHDILKMMPPEHVKAAQKKYPPRVVPNGTQVPSRPEPEPESEYDKQMAICKQSLSFKKSSPEIKSDIVNAISILTYDPRWKGVLRYDEFSQVLRFSRQPKWHADDASKKPDTVWTDNNTTQLDAWMRREWNLTLASQELAKAAYVVGHRDATNPLRDWLLSLAWDKQPRLSGWLTRYLGVEDSPYVQSVARKWMISAVARGITPGCKADHVIILEGGQGVGKSTALRLLAFHEGYFSDSPIDIGNKDAFVSLRGKWIIELAELASLSSAESEKSKAFFSSPVDSYRPPYGRELVQFPRSCVFAGTTNLGQYLKDDSGGRRYWPVRVGVIDLEGLEWDAEQLWAEAVAAFQAKEQWWPTYAETPIFQAEQISREVGDAWEEQIIPWLQSKQAETIILKQGYVTQMQLLHFAVGIDPKDATHAAQQRVSRVAYHLGMRKDRVKVDGSRMTVFYPGKK